MIEELKTAARVICARLRQRPYQAGVTISAWDAIVDQRADGKRYEAFSWQNALSKEVELYIAELDEATKRKIWESTDDCKVLPNADLATITECLYPFVMDAVGRPVHRAVRNRQKKLEGEP